MTELDELIATRLWELISSDPDLAALEVAPHDEGVTVRRRAPAEGDGEIVFRCDFGGELAVPSYRSPSGDGFALGWESSDLRAPSEVAELREALRALAATGRLRG